VTGYCTIGVDHHADLVPEREPEVVGQVPEVGLADDHRDRDLPPRVVAHRVHAHEVLQHAVELRAGPHLLVGLAHEAVDRDCHVEARERIEPVRLRLVQQRAVRHEPERQVRIVGPAVGRDEAAQRRDQVRLAAAGDSLCWMPTRQS
jgi:hypothetical protein